MCEASAPATRGMVREQHEKDRELLYTVMESMAKMRREINELSARLARLEECVRH
jgi:hypothetical protein